MSEPIRLQCPFCDKKLKAPANGMGRTVACPRCQNPFQVAEEFVIKPPVVAEMIEEPQRPARKPRPKTGSPKRKSRRRPAVSDDIEIIEDEIEFLDDNDFDDDIYDDYDEYDAPPARRQSRRKPPKAGRSKSRSRGSGSRGSEKGGRYVIYKFAISIIVLSFQRTSEPVYIAPGKSAVTPGWFYTLISLLCGWWGFPWGPIFTIGSIYSNLNGGVDVTKEIRQALR